jgi:hypothetical protein
MCFILKVGILLETSGGTPELGQLFFAEKPWSSSRCMADERLLGHMGMGRKLLYHVKKCKKEI